MEIDIPKNTRTVTLNLPEFNKPQNARLCDVLQTIDGPVEFVIMEADLAKSSKQYAPGWRRMGANGKEIHNFLVNTQLFDGLMILALPVAQISTEVVDRCLHSNPAVSERQTFTRVMVCLSGADIED